jgi:hypothetical protein
MLELTAADRCDRCGAQAHHKATLPKGGELFLCNHHYRENRDALLEQYWLIESDESPAEPVPVAAYTE